MEQQSLNETKFPFLFFKDKKFNEIKTLAVYQNTILAKDFESHLSDNFIFSRNNYSNDYFLENNQILKLSTIKKIINNSKFGQIIENDLEKIKNNVILIPNYFQKGRHNKKLFSVAIYNEDKSNINQDIAIVSKKLTNIPIFKNDNLETSFKLLKTEEEYEIQNYRIIGEIEIISNTYYDSINKVTKKRLGPGTKQGLFIPQDFIGEINPYLNLDINCDIQNINLGYQNAFYKFNSSQSNAKLKIQEITRFNFDNKNAKSFSIAKENYFQIIKNNYLWKDLKNLIIEEQNEK